MRKLGQRGRKRAAGVKDDGESFNSRDAELQALSDLIKVCVSTVASKQTLDVLSSAKMLH